MFGSAQVVKTAVIIIAILTAHISITPARASQCGGLNGATCYKNILFSAQGSEKYVSYFGSEEGVVNFARMIGNNACAAAINSSMKSDEIVQSIMKQYHPRLIGMGMNQPEASNFIATAVSAGVEVDCPTHINRALDASRPISTGISPR